MKIAGVDLQAPVVEELILPRGDQFIKFSARPVMDLDTFDKLCPEPKAPGRRVKGGQFQPDFENKDYKAACERHAELRMAYLTLRSLEATEGLEWDTVVIDNPNTWLNYKTELSASFGLYEVNRITALVMRANCLDERKLEEARKAFQAGQVAEADESSGRNTDPQISPSGEPA